MKLIDTYHYYDYGYVLYINLFTFKRITLFEFYSTWSIYEDLLSLPQFGIKFLYGNIISIFLDLGRLHLNLRLFCYGETRSDLERIRSYNLD